MTGRIRDLTTDRFGKTVLSLEINERGCAETIYDELNQCEKLDIDVKKFRKKRSLDANALAWVLMGKIAAKIGIPPENVYRNMIRDVGDNYEIIPIRSDAVEKFCEVWRSRGLGWVTDQFPSKLNGYINVMAYYGSSTYDTAQMHRLLDAIVDECKTQGIETRPQEEIESLLAYWETKGRKKEEL